MHVVASDTTRADVRELAWAVGVGLAAGALVGLVVGGLGGRLAMLLLRLTSPDFLRGATSDDGFEIGVVSTQTFVLLFGTAAVGGAFGVLYAVVRLTLAPRVRLPLWALAVTAVLAAAIVNDDGIDFVLTEPAALAVALFVAIPAAAAVCVSLLVERWMRAEPWQGRLRWVVAAGSLASTFAIVPAVLALALAHAARAAGAAALLRRVGRVAVPVVLVAATLVQGAELVAESWRLV